MTGALLIFFPIVAALARLGPSFSWRELRPQI